MTKIIGIENTERINAELEQLMEEVKKRTKTTITGVKIPELTEINTIDGTEMLIIEGKNGTQRTLVNNIPITELVDARNDGTTQHANLKDRLDEMTQNINENIANIGDITNAFNLLNKEVIDAREDNQVPSVTYPSLKERLDAMGASTTVANQALTLATSTNKEVEEARGGQPTLGDRLDGIDAEINDVDERVVKNEENITNIQQDFNVLNQEVIDARTDSKDPIETHNSLKERLDSDFDHLNSEIEKTNVELHDVKLNKVDKLEPKKGIDVSRLYRNIEDNVGGHASYLQGATKTIDDKVIYSIYDVTTPQTNIVDLIEVDLSTGNELRRKTLTLGHSNSIAYNSNTNELVIANLKKFVAGVETYVSELIVVDYVTLDIKRTVELGGQRVVRGVAYDNDNDKYMVLIDNFIVATCNSNDFSIEKETTLSVDSKIKTFIAQSLEVWNNHIYLCGYAHNYISVFDFDGNNIQNYYVPDYIDNMYLTGELEDISSLGNGEFLLFSCQNVGSLNVVNMISKFSVVTDVASGSPYGFVNAGGPKKIYVDSNSRSTNPTGTIDNPFKELHEAILSIHSPIFSYIEISLSAGTYEWTYIGDVNAPIRIIGNSKDDTFIKGIFINGSKVSIDKVGFKERGNTRYNGLISAFNAEVVINNVVVDSTSTHGIYANSGSTVSIRSLTDSNVSDTTYTIYGVNGSDIRFQKTAANIVKIYVDNSTRLYPHVMLYNNANKTELQDITLPSWATSLITANSFKFMDIVCGVRVTDVDDVLLQTYRIQTSNYPAFNISLNRTLQNYTLLSSTRLTGSNVGGVITLRHDNNYFTKIDANGTITTDQMTANKIGSILVYRIFLTN